MNNTTTDLIALKLDVINLIQLLQIIKYSYAIFFLSNLGVQKIPIQWERAPPYIREKYLDRHPEYRNYTTGAGSLHTDKINADQVLNFILGVSERTCQE